MMVCKKKSRLLAVLIMLGMLTQFFSSSAQAGKSAKIYPRSVELSGNRLSFSMPEDFSKDMPADDMVERLDITDLSAFKNGEYGNIIRRWWDIKTPGWFGKSLGSVMMNVSVLPVAENHLKMIHDHPYEMGDKLDFMIMVYDKFHQRFDKLNEEIGPSGTSDVAYSTTFAMVDGRVIKAGFFSPEFNGQTWISFGASAHTGMLRYFNIPLDKGLYVEVSFHLAHNAGVSAWTFTEAAEKKIDPILKSLKIDYRSGNPFHKIVGDDWHKITNAQALQQKEDAILKLFYGPDPDARILQLEKEAAEFSEKLKNGTLLPEPDAEDDSVK